MSKWLAAKAKRVLGALQRKGWTVKRQSGSHRLLARAGWPDYEFAFHDNAEVGPKMLARIAKNTGLRPEDLCANLVVKWVEMIAARYGLNGDPLQRPWGFRGL